MVLGLAAYVAAWSIACTETVKTEICEDGWERPVGECPEESDTDTDADTDTDTDTDTDADTDGDCDVEAEAVSPESGASDVSVMSAVHMWLSDPVSEGDLRLDGVEGELSWGDNEDHMVFRPSEPLSPSTEYEAIAEACGERMAVWRFTTSADGETDPGDLVGTTWLVDPGSGTVVEPEGVGSVLESYIEGALLLEVLSQGEGKLGVRGALADGSGAQDLCQPTDELELDYADAPVFRYGPADTTFGSFEFGDLELSGVVNADGGGLSGVRATGLVDTRPMAPLIDEDAGEEEVCNLMAGFGVECESCPDGTEFCVRVTLEDLEATELSASVVELETCDASCPEEDCGQCGCASSVGWKGGWMLGILGLAGLLRRRG